MRRNDIVCTRLFLKFISPWPEIDSDINVDQADNHTVLTLCLVQKYNTLVGGQETTTGPDEPHREPTGSHRSHVEMSRRTSEVWSCPWLQNRQRGVPTACLSRG